MGFNWDDSPVKKVAEDIRDNGESPLLTQSAQQEKSYTVMAESEKEITTDPTNEAAVDNDEISDRTHFEGSRFASNT